MAKEPLSVLTSPLPLQAGKWRQNWVLLHVYSKNASGVSLYQRNGYAELHRDPTWQQLLGKRQRLLLAKGASFVGAAGVIQSVSGSVMRIFQQQQHEQQAP